METKVDNVVSRGLALLVVDVQEAAVERGPYEWATVRGNIRTLLAAARAFGVEVIHVQHDGGAGEEDAPGSRGWEIHEGVRPDPHERVVRKRFNSAFRDTDLRSYLGERGIGTLIVVGIQTEYCVDTTCRVAFEHGYSVVLPEMTNTTFDNGELSARQIHEYHNRRIFDGRFAAVRSLDDALQQIRATGVAS